MIGILERFSVVNWNISSFEKFFFFSFFFRLAGDFKNSFHASGKVGTRKGNTQETFPYRTFSTVPTHRQTVNVITTFLFLFYCGSRPNNQHYLLRIDIQVFHIRRLMLLLFYVYVNISFWLICIHIRFIIRQCFRKWKIQVFIEYYVNCWQICEEKVTW